MSEIVAVEIPTPDSLDKAIELLQNKVNSAVDISDKISRDQELVGCIDNYWRLVGKWDDLRVSGGVNCNQYHFDTRLVKIFEGIFSYPHG